MKPALGETWKAMPNVRLLLVRDFSSSLCHVFVMKHTTMVWHAPSPRLSIGGQVSLNKSVTVIFLQYTHFFLQNSPVTGHLGSVQACNRQAAFRITRTGLKPAV